MPKDYSSDSIKNYDAIIWLTPTYKIEDKYKMTVVSDDKLKLSLKEIFSNLTFTGNIKNATLEVIDKKDNGFLIFKKNNENVAVFRIEGSVSNRRSVRWCKIIQQRKNLLIIHSMGDFNRGLESNLDFRELIKRIDTENHKIFTVHVLSHL